MREHGKELERTNRKRDVVVDKRTHIRVSVPADMLRIRWLAPNFRPRRRCDSVFFVARILVRQCGSAESRIPVVVDELAHHSTLSSMLALAAGVGFAAAAAGAPESIASRAALICSLVCTICEYVLLVICF